MSTDIYQIGILEDDPEIIEYLEDIFSESTAFNVAFSSALLSEAKTHIENSAPIDLCLVDLQLPDGDGTEFIKFLNGQAKSLVLTVLGDRTSVIKAFESGADGYLIKDSEEWEIIKNCTKTIQGNSPISPGAAAHLLKMFRTETRLNSKAVETSILTKRETDILTLFAKGLSYKEVAEMLELSRHTINDHTKNIYVKLNVHTKNEAIFEALQFGWIKI